MCISNANNCVLREREIEINQRDNSKINPFCERHVSTKEKLFFLSQFSPHFSGKYNCELVPNALNPYHIQENQNNMKVLKCNTFVFYETLRNVNRIKMVFYSLLF
jgi:hypothetical protein